MTNVTDWRERFRQVGAGSVRFIATRQEVTDFFKAELLLLAESLEGEKKSSADDFDFLGIPPADIHNTALDLAITKLKEMAK